MNHFGTASDRIFQGRTLVAGSATGSILRLTEPLSFWGGMEVATGRIIDQHHPQVGICLSGTILVMPAGRGSSSSSSVLAEAIYAGTAPAAIVLSESDVIVALGAMVAKELYGLSCPVVVIENIAVAEGVSVAIEATTNGAVARLASSGNSHLV
ncbi:MAG TPA: DUF126 domain-containing protein [Caldilineaceae bacterium]|nr:DUF126 domain-containing protein [Caldilineaceae bacterium]